MPPVCLVTAGPTCEPLDQVRRLTNASTGTLGTRLAAFLGARGHRVTLLRSVAATCRDLPAGCPIEPFLTTADLGRLLEAKAGGPVNAVFHAAAVSDFRVERIWRETAAGGREAVRSGKLDSREGRLFLELGATPKLIARLRDWFPGALLVGWKYEVDGDAPAAVGKAREQMRTCRTDVCVVNGPAWGNGFGLVTAGPAAHPLEDGPALFEALTGLLPAR